MCVCVCKQVLVRFNNFVAHTRRWQTIKTTVSCLHVKANRKSSTHMHTCIPFPVSSSVTWKVIRQHALNSPAKCSQQAVRLYASLRQYAGDILSELLGQPSKIDLQTLNSLHMQTAHRTAHTAAQMLLHKYKHFGLCIKQYGACNMP